MSVTLNAILETLALEADAIRECMDRLKTGPTGKTLEATVDIVRKRLDAGGRIVVIGLGKSGKVAQKIAATLSSTGSPAFFLHPTEALHGDIGMIGPQDTALALSYTGNTEEVIKLIPSLKNLGVPVIGMGGNPDSQLAKKSDHWIDAQVRQEACPNGLAPTTSTTLSMAIGDALAVALMKLRGFDAAAFAKNHPGGALGRRLTLRVADILRNDSEVAVVSEDASIDEIVISSTRSKLGAVLVAATDRKLQGIITDGDLRRSLQHREKFFSFKARDVMTRKPVTVTPGMMAQEALELMENRPSQISVLPVVDSAGNWIGLVRLHDLIQSL